MQLENRITSAYPGVVPPFKELRRTDFNLILESRNQYIIRISQQAALQDITFECAVIDHLNDKNIPVATILRNHTGKPYTKLSNHSFCTIFHNVIGYHPSISIDGPPILEEISTVARFLGEMHTALSDFPSNHKRQRTIYSELEIAKAHKTMLMDTYSDGQELLENIDRFLTWMLHQKPRIGVIHNDVRNHNIFLKDPRTVSAVIDFDWACYGPLIKDVALSALEWSYPDNEQFDEKRYCTFIENYNECAPEKINPITLPKWMAAAALSEAATYLTRRAKQNTDNQKNKQPIRSFMYDKFLFFSKYSG